MGYWLYCKWLELCHDRAFRERKNCQVLC